jgi:hypothetical protein
MKEHFKLLGFKVRDAVTGFEGVVESISFDLYGCVQAIVRPGLDKKKPNDLGAGHWFDTKRLSAIGKVPVMAIPTFSEVPGGSEKPAYPSKPMR